VPVPLGGECWEVYVGQAGSLCNNALLSLP
jgi:hypothetical protein